MDRVRRDPPEQGDFRQNWVGRLSSAPAKVRSFFYSAFNRQEREALRESEERYRSLFDRVPVGLYQTTSDGRILDANPALVEMLGYPDRETLLAINAIDLFVHPEDRWREQELLNQAGVLNYIELQLCRYDGSSIWVRDTVRTVWEDADGILYYDGSLEDITERKRAEEARSLLASIVESSQDAIIGIKLDGTIASWNSGAERIFGYSIDEVKSRSVSFLAPPDLHDEMPRLFTKIGQGERVEQYETARLRKDGKQIQVSLTLSPIIETGGKIIGMSEIARDITLQKQMEQYLIRAERLAAMGQVSTSLAHEVKNPLQAIRSNLELVRDFSLDPDEQEECLQTCCLEVDHLIEITQRMLSFARSERYTFHPIYISDVWQQALALLSTTLETASIQILADFPKELPPVFGVADQLRQVLLNLMLNSIEVMPGGGSLNVTALSAGPVLSITLSNSGPPIREEDLEHIFDPFFTTKPDGTGLGLFISHNIIQQHGGTLTVENLKDGSGVAFTITLPILSQEGLSS